MCQYLSYELFEDIAQKIEKPVQSVTVRPVHLNRAAAGNDYGMAFDAEEGYTTILWVGNITLRRGHQCHVWYEGVFDNDGSLVAISTFVRSFGMDARRSSLRTLCTNVMYLAGLAHLRFEQCGKRAGEYVVSGCVQPIRELIDLVVW